MFDWKKKRKKCKLVINFINSKKIPVLILMWLDICWMTYRPTLDYTACHMLFNESGDQQCLKSSVTWSDFLDKLKKYTF